MKRLLHVGQGGGIAKIVDILAKGITVYETKTCYYGPVPKLSDVPTSIDRQFLFIWVGNFRISQYIINAFRLYRFIRPIRPDIVVLHGYIPYVFGSVAAKLACRHCRTVAVDHGPQLTYQFWKILCLRLSHCFINHFISVSESSKSWMVKHFPFIQPSNIHVIENGIRLDRFYKNHCSPFSSPQTVLTMVSRFDPPQKDPLTLMRAFRYLIEDDGFDLRLQFIGDGILRPEIESYANRHAFSGRFLLTGFIDNIEKYLETTDIFILSTRWEGLPLSLIEAMACGLPVIASKVVGVVGVIDPDRTGLLVPPENPAALADAIRSLINNHAHARFLGKQAQQDAILRFDSHAMVSAYQSFFSSIHS